MYPNVDVFLHRPLISDPPMCTLRELQDGTYSIFDLELMHELLDLKQDLNKAASSKSQRYGKY